MASSLSVKSRYSWTMSTGVPASAARARAARPSPCAISDPAPTQTTAFERIVRSTSTGAPGGGGNGETPPGSNPVAAPPPAGARRASLRRRRPPRPSRGRPGGLPGRAPAPAVRRHMKTSDFTIWSRSQPIASAAALRRRRRRRELLQPRLRSPGAEEGGDALDRLGPGHRAIVGQPRRRQYRSGTMRQRTRCAIGVVVGVRRPARQALLDARSWLPRAARAPTARTSAGMRREQRVADEERDPAGVDRDDGRSRTGPLVDEAVPGRLRKRRQRAAERLRRPDRERSRRRPRAPCRRRESAPCTASGQSGGTKPRRGSRRP